MKFGNQERKKLAEKSRADKATLIEKKRLDNQYDAYLEKRKARSTAKKTQSLGNLVYEQQRGSSVLGKFKENAKKNREQLEQLEQLEREQREMEKRSTEELAQREIINILDTAAYDRQQQRSGSVLGKFKENTQKKQQARLKEIEMEKERKELEKLEIENRKELEKLEMEKRKELEKLEMEKLEMEKRKELERQQREIENRKELEKLEMEKRKELEQQPIHEFLPITEQTILPRRVKNKRYGLKQLNSDIKYLLMI